MYLLGLDKVKFVKNMEDSSEWQGLGADFEVEFLNGKKCMVEAKSDRYENGSLFLETECGANEGCFVKSKADVWVYCHFKKNVAYWLPMEVVRPYVLGNANRFKKRPAVSKEGGRTWTAWGLVVPITDLLENCDGVKVLHNIYEGSTEMFRGVFGK